MNISVNLSEADAMLFKEYAECRGISVSELIRQSVVERIESEYDINAYNNAIEEYKANPVTYYLDEVERELGLR